MTEINTNPEVRFAGFTEDWEERELSEILTERKVMQKISEDAPILAFAAGQGVIDRSERKSNNRDHLTHDQENKIYKLTELNDIVYNPSNLKYGAIDRNKHGRGVISPIYVTFTTEEESSFVELIVKSEKFKLRALQYEEGTVVKRQSVKPENLLSLKVNIATSKYEQKQIGLFFEDLQNLIVYHQLRFTRFMNLKKAMLDKMFPMRDAMAPEIRFKGFTKDWKIIPFDKVFDLGISTNSFSRSMLSLTEGNVKNIHYGDILIKYGVTLDANNSNIPNVINGGIGDYKNLLLKDGDIIMADAAEDYTVGKATEIFNTSNNPIIAGLHTIVCRPRTKIQPFYLGYYLNTNSYRNSLIPLFQGTKVFSISKSSLAKTFVKLPNSEDEQAKIGMYFLEIDNLISFHHDLKEKLVNLKNACFNKMTSILDG